MFFFSGERTCTLHMGEVTFCFQLVTQQNTSIRLTNTCRPRLTAANRGPSSCHYTPIYTSLDLGLHLTYQSSLFRLKIHQTGRCQTGRSCQNYKIPWNINLYLFPTMTLHRSSSGLILLAVYFRTVLEVKFRQTLWVSTRLNINLV